MTETLLTRQEMWEQALFLAAFTGSAVMFALGLICVVVASR